MTTVHVELSKHLKLTRDQYSSLTNDVYAEYVEHSTAHGFSDSITTVDIDRPKALEMIKFLEESFGIDHGPLRDVAGMLNEFLWYETVPAELKSQIESRLKSVGIPVDDGWNDDD